MLNRILLTLCCPFLSYWGEAQATAEDLLAKAEAYYQSVKNVSFFYHEKFKSAISTDTLTNTYSCIFQQQQAGKMLGQFFDSSILIIYTNEGSFYTYPLQKELFHNNSKQNDPEERLALVPYWRPRFIFKELVQEITPQNTTVKGSAETGYAVNAFLPSGIYLIEMDSLYRIKRFRQIVITKLGTQVKDERFEERGSSILSLATQLALARSEYINITNRKIKSKRVNDMIGQSVDVDSLRRILNLPVDNRANLYFDFFYKDCYPCIQSIPKVNELHGATADTMLKVYGIDSRKEDEGDWSKFRARYQMKYTVVDGNRAMQVQTLLLKDVFFGWPVNLVVSPDGKIIYVHEGYETKLVKEVIKAIGIKL